MRELRGDNLYARGPFYVFAPLLTPLLLAELAGAIWPDPYVID